MAGQAPAHRQVLQHGGRGNAGGVVNQRDDLDGGLDQALACRAASRLVTLGGA